MTAKPLRALIVDDERLARLALRTLLAGDPEALQQRIREAYSVCQSAIDEQLARAQSGTNSASALKPANGAPASSNNGNGTGSTGKAANGHPASDKQLTYARQLAAQIRGLGVRRLNELAQRVCSKPLADLSSLDASTLIDILKAVKAGTVELDAAMNGAPP